MLGAGVFGSVGVCVADAFLPCNLRLNVLALPTVSGVALVVCSALTKRVDRVFRPLKAVMRSFTLLLKAVFLVITSAKLLSAAVFSAMSCGSFKLFLVGLYVAPYAVTNSIRS